MHMTATASRSPTFRIDPFIPSPPRGEVYPWKTEKLPASNAERFSFDFDPCAHAHLEEKRFDLAAVELEKSVQLAVSADGCSCEPFNALAYVYVDAMGQYDKGWDLVRRARSSGHIIAREYVERLERATGKRG